MISTGSLVNPDPDGKLCQFLDQFLPVYDACIHGDSHALQSSRLNSVAQHRTAVGIDSPRYPPAPVPKINTLYWPTGASRWARGYFLVLGDNFLPSLPTETPFTLTVANAGPGGNWSCPLYVLSPRPLTGLAGATTADLWLIPVVDERYFWQFRHTSGLSVDTETTWSSVLNYLGTRLGASIAGSAPDAAYGIPDPEELSRKNINAAAVLDAVAHSVGARIVRSPSTGAVSLQTFAEAAVVHAVNALYVAQAVIAGGSLKLGPVPQYVSTVFRKYKEYRPYGDGSTHTVDNVQTATTLPIVTGAIKTIITTYYADFTTGSGSPDNASACNSLAAKITADYFLSLTQRHDVTLMGSVPWQPTAFDDHILWSFAAQGETQQKVQTRIQSPPYNMAVEEMLHQGDTLEVISSPVHGYLIDALAYEDHATFAVCRYEGTSRIDTGKRIEVWDTLLNDDESAVPAMVRMQPIWSDDDNRWLDGPANCEAEDEGDLPQPEE